MKKLLGIVVLGLLLAGCYAPGVREAQRTNPYMGNVELVKKGFNGFWTGYGHTRKEAVDKALKLCEIEKNEIGQGRCRINFSCDSRGFNCSSGSNVYNEPKKKIVKSSTTSGSQPISLSNIKSTCIEFGYKEETDQLADCMKELYLAQTQTATTATVKPKRTIDPSVWDDILNVSKGLGEGKSVGEALGGTTTGTSKIQCFKTGERVSGTNKICSYNCMGSETTLNIASTRLCPLSIDYN